MTTKHIANYIMSNIAEDRRLAWTPRPVVNTVVELAVEKLAELIAEMPEGVAFDLSEFQWCENGHLAHEDDIRIDNEDAVDVCNRCAEALSHE